MQIEMKVPLEMGNSVCEAFEIDSVPLHEQRIHNYQIVSVERVLGNSCLRLPLCCYINMAKTRGSVEYFTTHIPIFKTNSLEHYVNPARNVLRRVKSVRKEIKQKT